MDSSVFVRKADKVKAALAEQPDGSVLAVKDIKIYIPERFSQKGLATIASEIYIIGIFAIVVDDKYYGVSTANAMMHVKPTLISTVKFDDTTYLELYFEAGSTVIANTELVKNASLVFRIFDEIIAKGHNPWYLSMEDRAKLFQSADYHAGVGLSRQHAILEMIAAACARDSKNLTRYYRHSVQHPDDVVTNPATTIPLRSITYGTTNTTSKLLGSYFDQGMNSALVNPTTKVENIEDILRR